MNWLELHIDTTHAGLDTVTAMLSALDIDGVIIDDETDFQDFLENNHQYWDYVDEDLEKKMQGKSRLAVQPPALVTHGEILVALRLQCLSGGILPLPGILLSLRHPRHLRFSKLAGGAGCDPAMRCASRISLSAALPTALFLLARHRSHHPHRFIYRQNIIAGY